MCAANVLVLGVIAIACAIELTAAVSEAHVKIHITTPSEATTTTEADPRSNGHEKRLLSDHAACDVMKKYDWKDFKYACQCWLGATTYEYYYMRKNGTFMYDQVRLDRLPWSPLAWVDLTEDAWPSDSGVSQSPGV